MKNIAVINAYGEKNIGDATILEVALSLIGNTIPIHSNISVMCEDITNFSYLDINHFRKNKIKVTPYQNPYGYAIRSQRNSVSIYIKLIRCIRILLHSLILTFAGKVSPGVLPQRGFYSYVNSIRQSDVVISMGGGYFISKNKYKDCFGLLLTVLPILIAKVYKKDILFLPMSFGPFANKLHEAICYKAISGTTVFARDDITFDQIYNLDTRKKQIKLYYAPDLALFYTNKNKISIKQKLKSKYIILTAREWLSASKQTQYEYSLSKLVDLIWNKYKLQTVFIPMSWNSVEDNDLIVAQRIKSKITNRRAFTITEKRLPEQIQGLLNGARLAICTRMHSAILSSTILTPFVLIGYGHKSLGFAKKMNIENIYIDMQEVTKNNLINIFESLMREDQSLELIKKLNSALENTKDYQKIIEEEISMIVSPNYL